VNDIFTIPNNWIRVKRQFRQKFKIFALITVADLKTWYKNKKASRSNYIYSFTEGQ